MAEIQPPNNMLLFRIANLNTSISKTIWNTNYIVPPSVGFTTLPELLHDFHGKSVGLMVNWSCEIIMAKLAKVRACDKRKRSLGIIDDCEDHSEELELGARNEHENQGTQNFSEVMEVAGADRGTTTTGMASNSGHVGFSANASLEDSVGGFGLVFPRTFKPRPYSPSRISFFLKFPRNSLTLGILPVFIAILTLITGKTPGTVFAII
ncbi:hypothetical protein LIER_04952 [Lithospermum erythrorhizon]|uniref:Uncharacterized protein n=1 Tax=Lithospermum erythrorhizon TaxID=34254 RepID=A0AAV3P3A2_LITER